MANRNSKHERLEQQGALNRHPERVNAPQFQIGSFFDPNDLVQVKSALLRQITPSAVSTPANMFAPAVTYNAFGDSVDVYFTLAEDLEADIKLEFLEPNGDVITSFEAKKKAGEQDDDEEE